MLTAIIISTIVETFLVRILTAIIIKKEQMKNIKKFTMNYIFRFSSFISVFKTGIVQKLNVNYE